MAGRFLRKRSLPGMASIALAVCLVGTYVWGSATSVNAAEREVVGVLAIAAEPDVAESLGLTDNQRTQLQELIDRYESDALDMASSLRDLSPDQRRAKLAALRREAEREGLALLSIQQRAKLEQMRLKREGLSALVDSSLADRLNLSDDQRARIRELLEKREQAVMSLEDEAEADRLRREYEVQIAATLTDQQRRGLQQIVLGTAIEPNPEEPAEVPQQAADIEAPAAPDEPPAPDGLVQDTPETAASPEEPDTPAVAAPETAPEGSSEPSPDESASPTAETDSTQPTPNDSATGEDSGPQAGESATDATNGESEGETEAESSEPATTVPEEMEHPAETNPGAAHPAQQPASESAEATADDQAAAESTEGVSEPVPAPATEETSPPSESGSASPSTPEEVAAEPQGAMEQPESGSESAADTAGDSSEAVVPEAEIASEGTSDENELTDSPHLPGDDVQLRFNFRYQPWDEVIEWLADQAGLSLVMDAPPPGTFNYVDDRAYTPAQAIDLLNSVLLLKGYVLIRRDRMLIVINTEDGIPENLIDTVSLDDLDDRGEYELVSVLFQLRRLSPEQAEAEVSKLLGPQGKITVLPNSRQLFVTDTAGRLRTIRKVIEASENPTLVAGSEVRTFDLNPNLVEQTLTVLRQLLGIAPDQTASEDGTFRFALDPTGHRLLVTGTPEVLDRVEEILREIDPSATGGAMAALSATPQLEVFPVTSADPESVLQVVQTLMAGFPDVRLALDPETGNLIAWARPAQLATIRATLDQMQEDSRLVEVIPLRVVDPQVAVLAINKLFGIDTESTEDKNLPTVDADLSTRQLLVRGSRSQIEQIRELLQKMGETTDASSSPAGAIRTIPMSVDEAQTLLKQIQEIWPQMGDNRLQLVTPSAVVPTMRNGEGTAPEEAEEQSIRAERIDLGFSGSPTLLLGTRRSSDADSGSQSNQQRPEGGFRGFPGGGFPGGGFPGGGFRPPFGGFGRPEGGDRDHDRFRGSQFSAAEGHVAETATRTGASRSLFRFAAQTNEVEPESPDGVEADGASEPANDDRSEGDSGKPPIVISVTPEGLVIASEDIEALNRFEDLVRTMVSGGAADRGPQLVFYYLKHAKAEQVAVVIDQILGGGTLTNGTSSGGGGSLIGDMARMAFGDIGGGLVGSLLEDDGVSLTPSDTIQITPDSRLNALIVQAYPSDLELIEKILKVLDRPDSPEEVLVEPKTVIIPVENTQAEEILAILKEVYQDRLVQSSSSRGGAPSPEQIMQLLRSRGGGGRGGTNQEEEQQKMALSVDSRTNSIVVSAPEPLMSEVKELIAQLDQKAATDSDETMQVIPIGNANPDAIRDALSALLGEGVGFGSSSRSRSSQSSSSRPSSSSSSSSGFRPPFGGSSPFFQRFGGFSGRSPFGGGGFSRPGGGR
ncbi:hypothetical protein JCM19992_19410 [Thermostilla marina]